MRNITIVQCYVPTEDADADLKACFYSILQDKIHDPKKNILIVLGDLNAKFGTDLGLEQIMGKRQNNEQKWRNLCRLLQ